MSDFSQPVGPATPSQPVNLSSRSLSQEDIIANRVMGEIDAILNATGGAAHALDGKEGGEGTALGESLSKQIGTLEAHFGNAFINQPSQNQTLISLMNAMRDLMDEANKPSNEEHMTLDKWKKIGELNNNWKTTFNEFPDKETIQANRFIGEIDAILNDTQSDAGDIDGMIGGQFSKVAERLAQNLHSQISNLEASFSFSSKDKNSAYQGIIAAMHDYQNAVNAVCGGTPGMSTALTCQLARNANNAWAKSLFAR